MSQTPTHVSVINLIKTPNLCLFAEPRDKPFYFFQGGYANKSLALSTAQNLNAVVV